MFLFFQDSRGITDDRNARRNILGQDCAHADDRALADLQGFFRCALTENSPGAYIRAVCDMDISVALYGWSKSYKIAYFAIMSNLGINICMKTPPNDYVRR